MSAAPRARVQRRPVHGVLLLDKPLGLTSNQALQPCTDYYKNLDNAKFKEALKNSIKSAPMGIDRFGLCITPTSSIHNCSGKTALFWLEGCYYLWSFNYYSDDCLIYRSSSCDVLAIRCVRNVEK